MKPWAQRGITIAAVLQLLGVGSCENVPCNLVENVVKFDELTPEHPGFIVVDPNGAGFVNSSTGESFVPFGVNYDRDNEGALLESYWRQDCERLVGDMEEIAALGRETADDPQIHNTVRIFLQLHRFMGEDGAIKPFELARLDQMVELARQNNLYLILTGLNHFRDQNLPEQDTTWFLQGGDETRIAAERRFWSSVALRYRNHPNIFAYNLQNEPVIDVGNRDTIVGDSGPFASSFVNYHYLEAGRYFTQWVQETYTSEENFVATADWGPSLCFPGGADQYPDIDRGESWDKILPPGEFEFCSAYGRIVDYDKNRHQLASQWADKMISAIREFDDNHMITIGLTDWSLPYGRANPDTGKVHLYSGFSPHILQQLDYFSIHMYPVAPDDGTNIEHEIAILTMRSMGKPVFIEETYPLRTQFRIEPMMSFLQDTSRLVAGYTSFYWGLSVEDALEDAQPTSQLYALWLQSYGSFGAIYRSQSPVLPNWWDESIDADVHLLNHGVILPDGSRVDAEDCRSSFVDHYVTIKSQAGDRPVHVNLCENCRASCSYP